jgi:hypothetical protein
MSEVSKPFTAEEVKPASIDNKRVVWLTAVVLIIGALYCAVFAERRDLYGVLIGGGLFFANYFWLDRSLAAVFDGVARGEKPRFLAAKYLLRYMFVGCVIAFVYYTGIASILTTVFGFAAISVAVVIEGFIRIFTSIFKRGNI